LQPEADVGTATAVFVGVAAAVDGNDVVEPDFFIHSIISREFTEPSKL